MEDKKNDNINVKKSSKKKLIFLIAGIVLLVAAIALGIFYFLKRKDNYWEAEWNNTSEEDYNRGGIVSGDDYKVEFYYEDFVNCAYHSKYLSRYFDTFPCRIRFLDAKKGDVVSFDVNKSGLFDTDDIVMESNHVTYTVNDNFSELYFNIPFDEYIKDDFKITNISVKRGEEVFYNKDEIELNHGSNFKKYNDRFMTFGDVNQFELGYVYDLEKKKILPIYGQFNPIEENGKLKYIYALNFATDVSYLYDVDKGKYVVFEYGRREFKHENGLFIFNGYGLYKASSFGGPSGYQLDTEINLIVNDNLEIISSSPSNINSDGSISTVINNKITLLNKNGEVINIGSKIDKIIAYNSDCVVAIVNDSLNVYTKNGDLKETICQMSIEESKKMYLEYNNDRELKLNIYYNTNTDPKDVGYEYKPSSKDLIYSFE